VQFGRVEIPLGHSTLSIESGRLAKQAHGAVVVRYGDTMVLVTACEGSSDPNRDFFP
jgi:polyribonucleotide nucleotidyltransferase